MKRFLNLVLIITTICLCGVSCDDKDETQARMDFVAIIQKAEKIVAETEEGVNKGDIAPGAKKNLQAWINWAYFILDNSNTDEAYTNAGNVLDEAIVAFYKDVVKEGFPLFDVGSKMNLGIAGSWNQEESFTVECNVYYTKLENGDQNIISCEGWNGGWMLRNSGSVVQFYINDGGWAGCQTPALETNKWYHIAATYKASTGLVLYLDGVEVGRSGCGRLKVDAGVNLQVGTAPSYDDRYMRGYVQHLSLWSDVRSADEVVADMACDFDGGEEGLDAYWPLTLNVGVEVTDKTGKRVAQLSEISWVESIN